MPMHHDHIPGHTPHEPVHDHNGKEGVKAEHAKRHTKTSDEQDATIEEGLQAIYGDDRSDLHKVERDSSRLTRMLTRLVLGLALLAILAFGGFFIYTSFFDQNTAKQPLVMSIEAPAEVKSGEQVQIIVNYSNPSGTPLAALELDINLPSSFVLSMAQPQPTNADDLIWNIGSLGSHSDGQLVLEGVWLSSVPATTSVQALAAYRPGNFNSNFSDIATATVTTLSSVLTLELEGPETATPGQELTYTATVKNTGLKDMTAAHFELTLPTGFILTSSTPDLQAGADPEWELGNLLPEATTEVIWKGSFTAEISDVQQFSAGVSVPEADRQLPQSTAQWFTDVAGSDLQTTLAVNGNSDKATTELGGTLRVSVRLENAGETDISGASLLLDFKPDSGVPVIWSSAALAGGKLTSAGIAFDTTVVGVIKAGEKKTYNLSFPIKEALGATEVDEWTVTAYVTVGEAKVQTPPFPISMKASANLSASARFYSESGAPIGEGPLPPEVGESTTYRVFWKIAKAVHELEDLVVTATIPPDVTWSDRILSSTGNVQFDSATQTIRWEISGLPANEEATAEFSVELIPGDEDVDTFVKLLSGSVLSATDAETKTTVEASAESFTTEIPADTFAAGKGTVVD
ncbi:MAG: hypothetical protein AAB776_02805 [Patescibacteria group bacterium]